MTGMFILCFVIIAVCVLVITNLLLKNEKYEEKIAEYEEIIVEYQNYYKQITEAIEYSDLKLKQVDHRGTFKSDDEIGYFFKLIQDLQTLLNSFNYSKSSNKKEESTIQKN